VQEAGSGGGNTVDDDVRFIQFVPSESGQEVPGAVQRLSIDRQEERSLKVPGV